MTLLDLNMSSPPYFDSRLEFKIFRCMETNFSQACFRTSWSKFCDKGPYVLSCITVLVKVGDLQAYMITDEKVFRSKQF